MPPYSHAAAAAAAAVSPASTEATVLKACVRFGTQRKPSSVVDRIS